METRDALGGKGPQNPSCSTGRDTFQHRRHSREPTAPVPLGTSLHSNGLEWLHLPQGNNPNSPKAPRRKLPHLPTGDRVNTDLVLGRGASWYHKEELPEELIAGLAGVGLQGAGGRAAAKGAVGTLAPIAAAVVG